MKRELSIVLALGFFVVAATGVRAESLRAVSRVGALTVPGCAFSPVSVYNGCGYDPYGYPGRLDTNGFGPFGYNGTYYTGYNGYSTYGYNPAAYAEPCGYGGYSYRNSGRGRTMSTLLQKYF